MKLQSSHQIDVKGDRRYKARVALDGGNRTICWSDGTNTRVIPAYVLELPDYQDVPDTFDDRTVLIESAVDGEDKRFLVGQTAKSLHGSPIYELSKADVTWLLALVASEPHSELDVVLIDELRVLFVDSRSDEAKRLKAIASAGIDFKRNGKPCVVTIRSVVVEDEGAPVHRYAMKNGMYRYPDRPNAVIDLGGGDGSARVFTPEGLVDRKADLNLPGTVELASLVTARIQSKTRFTPSQGDVMDAIERGDYVIQVPSAEGFSELNFTDDFLKAQKQWIQNIRQRINSEWSSRGVFATLGGGVIVGGSAPLAKDFERSTNGRFIVAESANDARFAQLISLYGMLEA